MVLFLVTVIAIAHYFVILSVDIKDALSTLHTQIIGPLFSFSFFLFFISFFFFLLHTHLYIILEISLTCCGCSHFT